MCINLGGERGEEAWFARAGVAVVVCVRVRLGMRNDARMQGAMQRRNRTARDQREGQKETEQASCDQRTVILGHARVYSAMWLTYYRHDARRLDSCVRRNGSSWVS